MNIFYLDNNPRLCASYHADKHVVKMILESAQLLCTAINVKAGEQVTPYKTTHVNHPCSIWVRESYFNWSYTFNLMLELHTEWQFRYEHTKRHKSVEALVQAGIVGLARDYIDKGLTKPFTPPTLAMPDYCKVSSDPVECYREYYRKEKVALHQWTNREAPYWL